jgi:hypothetical protein
VQPAAPRPGLYRSRSSLWASARAGARGPASCR